MTYFSIYKNVLAGVVLVGVLLLAGCANAPAKPSQDKAAHLAEKGFGSNVEGISLYTRLEINNEKWSFGPITTSYSPPSKNGISVKLNDLMPEAKCSIYKRYAKIYGVGGGNQCNYQYPFGPFEKDGVTASSVAKGVIGDTFLTVVTLGIGIVELPNATQRIFFNMPEYKKALREANTNNSYVSNRENLIQGYDKLVSISKQEYTEIGLSRPSGTPNFTYLLHRFEDKSGLYRNSDMKSIAVGKSVDPIYISPSVVLDTSIPTSHHLDGEYINKLFSNPVEPFNELVEEMKQDYKSQLTSLDISWAHKLHYSLSCNGTQYNGIHYKIMCPHELKVHPKYKIPVSIVITGKSFNAFPVFQDKNKVISINVDSNGVNIRNLTNEYVHVTKLSLYWKHRISTNNVDLILPPEGELDSLYDLSNFNIAYLTGKNNFYINDATKISLEHRYIYAGFAIQYQVGDKAGSLFKHVNLTGADLVKMAKES